MTIRPPDQYALIGYPVCHCKSPLIHALFASQTDQNLEYHALLAEPGKFAETGTSISELWR